LYQSIRTTCATQYGHEREPVKEENIGIEYRTHANYGEQMEVNWGQKRREETKGGMGNAEKTVNTDIEVLLIYTLNHFSTT